MLSLWHHNCTVSASAPPCPNNTPTSDKVTGDSKWTKPDIASLAWNSGRTQDGERHFPHHSVILNNILPVDCMPVQFDGSQPWERHAFFSLLVSVISVELTDSTGRGSVTAAEL